MVYMGMTEGCPLPTLLADSRHRRQMKTDDAKCAAPARRQSATSQKLDLQRQMKTDDAKCAAPARTLPLKMPAQAVNCSRPRSAGTSAVPSLFRSLKENEKIEDYFFFGGQIESEGQIYDKVLNAKKKNVGRGEIAECVVKVQRKRKMKRDQTMWRTVMTKLFTSKVSQNVLKLQAIFEDQKAFYIVMEKCSGGELFTFLLNETEVPVSECKRIIREILMGLNDLHSEGLIHADVKPENIMFSDEVIKTVKLIDFDTCQQYHADAPRAQYFTGSPGYIAPEALRGKASPQSDLWAVGVILFILMTGNMPWEQAIHDTWVHGPSAQAAYAELQREDIDWSAAPWPEFPVAADLCGQLLAFNPHDRLQSAPDALDHPWFQQQQRK